MCSLYLKNVSDRLLVLEMFILHVYGVTISCSHRLHLLGVSCSAEKVNDSMNSCRFASLLRICLVHGKFSTPWFPQPSRELRDWCHHVEMSDGAHFPRRRQRVFDLVKMKVDDAPNTCVRGP